MTEFYFPKLEAEEIVERFPLHWYVWNDNTEKLDEFLRSKLVSI